MLSPLFRLGREKGVGAPAIWLTWHYRLTALPPRFTSSRCKLHQLQKQRNCQPGSYWGQLNSSREKTSECLQRTNILGKKTPQKQRAPRRSLNFQTFILPLDAASNSTNPVLNRHESGGVGPEMQRHYEGAEISTQFGFSTRSVQKTRGVLHGLFFPPLSWFNGIGSQHMRLGISNRRSR